MAPASHRATLGTASQYTPLQGPLILGQTECPSGTGVHEGSSQTYVLVKVSIQRAEEKVTGVSHQFEACKHRWRAPNTLLCDR